jgi:hypothetical protein
LLQRRKRIGIEKRRNRAKEKRWMKEIHLFFSKVLKGPDASRYAE